MGDPYKVLGVSPSASDEEVKAAYRALAKKYHPDHYADTPLSDLASEKMQEVNEAYDTIMRMRKEGNNSSYNGAYNNGGYRTGNYQTNYGYSNPSYSNYQDVRNMIRGGRIADAEQILNGVPTNSRDAEWYFLKGTVLQRRGWMDDALNHFQIACQRDQNNLEYRTAMNQLQMQRSGYYGGYNTARPNSGGCDNGCDICSSLLCADCCCECMGGDLVPCC